MSRVRAVINHNTIRQHFNVCNSRLDGNAIPTYIITCVDFSPTNKQECCD